MSLPTPVSKVEKLQAALQAKAKADAGYRFYTLWDKVCRLDVLAEAYRRCRENRGASGVDGQTFEQIESAGVGPWLASLQEELRQQDYRPQPLLRVWIEKSNVARGHWAYQPFATG
jgi:retron-type reverse transcriptase